MQHMTRQCQWYNNPGWEVEIERQTFKAVLIQMLKADLCLVQNG